MVFKYSILFFLFAAIKLSVGAIVYDKANSPYYITDSLIINTQDTLIITEGAILFISPDAYIRVYGHLFIFGTESEPVQVLPAVDTVGWGNIEIINPGAHCSFEHVEIRDGCVYTMDVAMDFDHVDFINHQYLPWQKPLVDVHNASAKFQNCYIEGTGRGEGCHFINMSNLLVKNCTFYNIPDAVECSYVYSSTISNNFFNLIKDDAIDLNACHTVVIDSNIIIGATNRGIEIGSEGMGSSSNILIRRNLVRDCGHGIVFKEGSDGYILNNTLVSDSIGIMCIELVPGSGGSSILVENTIIYGSIVQDVFVDSISVASINYSLSDGTILEGSNNIIADPQFIDPINNDFNLADASPCINSGNPESPLDPDLTIADIGVFYFDTDSVSIVDAIFDISSIKVFPNPFKSYFHVSFFLRNAGLIEFTLIDTNGRVVYSKYNYYKKSGPNYIMFNSPEISNLPSGYYFLKISIDDQVKSFPIIKYSR